MSVLTCMNCDRATNSAVSRHLFDKKHKVSIAPEGTAWECWAAYVDGGWVEGCAFESAHPMDKHFAKTLINNDR